MLSVLLGQKSNVHYKRSFLYLGMGGVCFKTGFAGFPGEICTVEES